MSEPDAIAEVIHEWIIKADNDLKVAVLILKSGKDAPTETICFHAQQCVEKYLKSLLVLHTIPVPKTHKIHEVLELLADKSCPEMDHDVQKQMTSYAVNPRYPDGRLSIPFAEARKAVAVARRVRKEVRRLLPRAALRRPKK